MRYSRMLLIACYVLLSLSQACKKDDDEEPKKTTSIPCLPAGLSGNVIAFYTFAGGSLNDVSGNGIHLSNTTTKFAADRNGNPDCAAEFDNSPNNVDSLVATNTQKLNNLNAFSVSLWYQPLDTMVHTVAPPKSIKREYMVRYGNWHVMLFDCRKASFDYYNSNNTGYSVWDTDIVAPGTPDGCQQQQKLRTGTWHHLVVTFDKTNNVAKIYRDNVLQQTVGSSTGWTSSAPNFTSLVLGSSFTGRMDDVAIFNKALSDTEIDAVYQTQPCCSL